MSIPLPRAAQLLCLSLLAALALPAFAQTEPEDFSELDKAWRELAHALPAAPADADLYAIYAGPTASQKFYVDGKSISVGRDGVVRYTLVSMAQGGAKNVSYEGLRCDVKQKRVYAFGRPDGSWSRSRKEDWEPVPFNGLNRPHATLVTEILCGDGLVGGTPKDMVQRLKHNGSASSLRGGYTHTPGDFAN